MMSTQLSVILDKPYDYYTAGDKVTGHVLIHPRSDDALRDLKVCHMWTASGEVGSGDDGKDKEVFAKVLKVSDKKLKANKDHKFRFEFTAERTPVTHRGTTLDVSWLIRADAKLTTGGRLTEQAEYIQLAGKRESHKKGKPLLANKTSLDGVGNMLFRRICNSRVTLRPQKVWAGQSAICTVELKPKSDATINAVHMHLVHAHTKVTGKRKSPSVDLERNIVITIEFPSAARDVSPGNSLTLDGLFTVPTGGAPSSSKNREKVEWLVELEVDVARWPDLKETYPLIVLPD
jgi:hypothetical protein